MIYNTFVSCPVPVFGRHGRLMCQQPCSSSYILAVAAAAAVPQSSQIKGALAKLERAAPTCRLDGQRRSLNSISRRARRPYPTDVSGHPASTPWVVDRSCFVLSFHFYDCTRSYGSGFSKLDLLAHTYGCVIESETCSL
jgi:hypothetical protein